MADRLRELLGAPRASSCPVATTSLSAMILERAGFQAVFMSGYGVAASLLGNPDIGLTSLVETALMAKNITHAIHVPLVVDADNGYGDEDNVVRTVYELERAGAAAMILEDQVFPEALRARGRQGDHSARQVHAKARVRARGATDVDGHRGAHRRDFPRRGHRAGEALRGRRGGR